MRLAVLRSLPWKIAYLVLAALLILLLASIGSSGTSKQTQSKKEPFPSAVQGESGEAAQNNSQSTGGNKNSDQGSTSTKVDVSVHSNTTNGETTGSANVEVSKDGQTQTVTQDLDKIISGNNVSIKVDNGKVDFDFNLRQHSKTKSSIDQKVDVENDSH